MGRHEPGCDCSLLSHWTLLEGVPFLNSKEKRRGLSVLNAAQSPSFLAFTHQLPSSSTSVWPCRVPASLVPSGGSDDNTSRDGISAGVWLFGIMRAWGYGVPACTSIAMRKRTIITNSPSDFTPGPLQLSIKQKNILSISQEITLISGIKPK